MEPFEALTEEDKANICAYIKEYVHAKPSDLKKILSVWNASKRTLFKAFGGKLRVTIPYTYKKSFRMVERELQGVYYYYYTNSHDDLSYFANLICRNHYEKKFYGDFYIYIKELKEKGILYYQSAIEIVNLFSYKNMYDGKIDHSFTINLNENSLWGEKSLFIPTGSKIIKTIKKIADFLGYENKQLFEDWRNEISNITTNKDVTQNLVLSIHPIDFMTMSDNNCDWHSCMSWIQDGCYSTGTIEMMNSNIVVCAYLESHSKFMPIDGVIIPNKSWRVLLYVHKQIIATGKQYPYFNKDLSLFALTAMRELVEHNLKWHYKYIDQEYLDHIHIYNNNTLKYKSRKEKSAEGKDKHSIYIYTEAMYNDIVEDNEYSYYCCRNYVEKSLKLNASGPVTCMCCGKKFHADEIVSKSQKICNDCYKYHTCRQCGMTSIDEPVYMIEYSSSHTKKRYCINCIKEMYYNTREKYFSHSIGLDILLLNPQANLISIITKYLPNIISYNDICNGINTETYNKIMIDLYNLPANDDYIFINRDDMPYHSVDRKYDAMSMMFYFSITPVTNEQTILHYQKHLNQQGCVIKASEVEDLYGLIDTLRQERLSRES